MHAWARYILSTSGLGWSRRGHRGYDAKDIQRLSNTQELASPFGSYRSARSCPRRGEI
jgi:hypothetical protein